MKTKKILLILLILFVVGGILSVNAAPLSSSVVYQPWTTKILMEEEDGVINLSSAFVGTNQIPMVSYSKVGSTRIYQVHAATPSVEGNCGPGNSWYCNHWNDASLIPNSVSNLANMPIIDTHLVGWAYSTGTTIRGAMVEFMNDMTFVDDDWDDLIQLNKFGGVLVGAPSLQIIGGHYRMAALIRSGSDFPTYRLVYMYYIGNVSNTTCMDDGYAYQCDVIEESMGYNSMGVPSLKVAPDATVGIAYYKYGGGTTNGIKYAYPHTSVFSRPTNCGPGDPKTWRCIDIFSGTDTGDLGDIVKFAFGATSSERGIVFTYDDTLIDVTLKNAEYVGNGGNCGQDGITLNPVQNIYAWHCSDVANLGVLSPTYDPSYSIAIDPDGYAVIAYDHALSEFSPFNLYIAYPNARIGSATDGWTAQRIDSAPDTLVATGAQAAISLNGAGLGFISYLQQEDYEPDDLKIALQLFDTFLPIVLR